MNQFIGNVGKSSINKYLNIFIVLTLLFLFRVSAQLTQLFFNFSWLPSFSTWQSGALPYWSLIILQVAILAVCLKIISQFRKDPPDPNAKTGKTLLVIGWLYLFLAIMRILLGATIAQEHFWLNAPLPSAFHIVLASFIITFGHYHFNYSKQ